MTQNQNPNEERSNETPLQEQNRIVVIQELLKNIKKLDDLEIINEHLVCSFRNERYKTYKEWAAKNHPSEDHLSCMLMFSYLKQYDRTMIVWVNKTEFATVRGVTVDGYSFTEIDNPDTLINFMYKVILYAFV